MSACSVFHSPSKSRSVRSARGRCGASAGAAPVEPVYAPGDFRVRVPVVRFQSGDGRRERGRVRQVVGDVVPEPPGVAHGPFVRREISEVERSRPVTRGRRRPSCRRRAVGRTRRNPTARAGPVAWRCGRCRAGGAARWAGVRRVRARGRPAQNSAVPWCLRNWGTGDRAAYGRARHSNAAVRVHNRSKKASSVPSSSDRWRASMRFAVGSFRNEKSKVGYSP